VGYGLRDSSELLVGSESAVGYRVGDSSELWTS
jgi:hypothetical protein